MTILTKLTNLSFYYSLKPFETFCPNLRPCKIEFSYYFDFCIIIHLVMFARNYAQIRTKNGNSVQ